MQCKRASLSPCKKEKAKWGNRGAPAVTTARKSLRRACLVKELSESQLTRLTTPTLQQLAEFASSILHDSPLESVPRDGSDTVRLKKVMAKAEDFRDVSSGTPTSISTDPKP